ncbi:class I SAM-dependent methyltransferase [Aquincola sp. MAHUQ-54]|uniref:Class I SAM-dependent methyltransferase n=1 Tax=Aquincola agrisoli TaxID=3119538 RepID=A0AAW9QAM3_9BURK
MFFLETLLVLGLVVIGGVGLLTWRKIRAVHLATYKLLSDVAAIRTESENFFSQVQALLALERRLQLDMALPAMRGWAGSPDFLLHVAEQIHQRRPAVIVECSSGVSTIVAARCLQQLGAGHVWSLEHEEQYAQKTRDMLVRYGLSDWATVLHAPLQTTHTSTPWYQEDVLPINIGQIDMLVVDGPPAGLAPMVRAPAFPRLRSRLAPNCIVLVDDADRPDETEMVRQWAATEPGLVIERPTAEKGLAMAILSTKS